MLNLMWKIVYYESLLLYKRSKLVYLHCLMLMPPFVLETRCAIRMESIAGRLRGMQDRIAKFEKYIHDGTFREAIDEDHSIRKMLQGLKEDIRTVRLEVAAMRGKHRPRPGGSRLGRALEALNRIAEETYLAADRLLWEIEQHDSPRL
jgi:hypothetical protein